MDWLTENAWLGWLGISLILGAIEAATVDFVFLMFAGGALAGAVAAALGAPFFFQVAVAVAAALGLLLVVRPMLRNKFLDTETDHRIGASSLVGREAWVLQTVTQTDGRIKLAGETWSARLAGGGTTVEPGDEVRVVAIHGATAVVVPLAAPAGTAGPPDPTTPTT